MIFTLNTTYLHADEKLILKSNNKKKSVHDIQTSNSKFICFYKTKGKVCSELIDLDKKLSKEDLQNPEKVIIYINDIYDSFNKSLRPGESPRIFHSVHKYQLQVKLEKLFK